MAGETAARLRILGYPGSLGEPSALDAALDAGARSVEFTGLCSWLVSQLKSVCPSIEESISPTQGPEEADSFQLEASGVVSELHCPYTALTTGEVTTRLTSRDNCLNLLRFLMSELQAARVLKVADPPPVETDRRGDGGRARGEIQLICQALEIEPKSLHNPALLTEVQNMVSLRLHALPDSGVMNPLLKRQLNSELWSRSSSMSSVIFPLEAALLPVSLVSLSHLLAAREDTSRIVKTSSGSSRLGTSCAVNKILMGSVPDRGGRPGEIEPPMPSWERRRGGGRPQHQQRRLPGKKRKDK
ncbi:protein FAM98A-like isoform X2 [Polyodon spathula]|uniref:protein FAM98A-like isoform X2 n=1 Tax=Polyodon spathula TaxID=7913 RepID=UPI001B7DA139|nr:protein FAM98A-like isoform X2 [Polyodon spathula]